MLKFNNNKPKDPQDGDAYIKDDTVHAYIDGRGWVVLESVWRDDMLMVTSPQSIDYITVDFTIDEGDDKCTCDIMVLLARGCQCGGK